MEMIDFSHHGYTDVGNAMLRHFCLQGTMFGANVLKKGLIMGPNLQLFLNCL